MRGLMLPYGDEWRRWRRVLHSGFHSRRAETYKDIQSVEAKVLLHELLQDPEAHEQHLQRYAHIHFRETWYIDRVPPLMN